MTPRHEAALQAIEEGATLKEAAEVVEVTPRTLRRWRQTVPGFAVRLRQARLASVDLEAIDAATVGVQTLVAIATDPKVETKHRLKAAEILTERGLPEKVKRMEIDSRSVRVEATAPPSMFSDQQLSAMSPEQIRAALEGLEGEPDVIDAAPEVQFPTPPRRDQ